MTGLAARHRKSLDEARQPEPPAMVTEQIGHDARKAHKTSDGQFLWTYASVKNILTEEAYTGVLINHRRECQNGKSHCGSHRIHEEVLDKERPLPSKVAAPCADI